MLNVVIYALGLKGLNLVKGALKAIGRESVLHVVIGLDKSIQNDMSNELLFLCRENGIDSSYRGDIEVTELDYSIVLAVGWRWLIHGVPTEKLIIFHDSLLPKYRGFAPLVNALLNKDPIVGVTALYGAMDYDCGNILGQISMPVSYPTEINHVIDDISILYSDLAVEILQGIEKGALDMKGYEQDASQASYSLWRDDEDYRINWNESAKDIVHFISCLGFPYQGASSLIQNEPIRILSAKCIPDVIIENRDVGKVIFIKDSFPVVVCGEGLIQIETAINAKGSSILPLNSFRVKFK